MLYSSIVAYSTAKRRRRKVYLLFCITSGFACLLGMGSRSYVAQPAMVCLLLYHYYIRPLRWRSLFVLGAICFFLFSAFEFYRTSSYFGYSQLDIYQKTLGIRSRRLAAVMPSIEYARSPIVVLSQEMRHVPSSVPYQNGLLLLMPLESLLPGHHIAEDVWLSRNIMGINLSIGAGTPGTMFSVYYGDFGYAGVIVEMFLLGLLMRWAYRRADKGAPPERAIVMCLLTKDLLFGLFASPFHYILDVVEPFAVTFAFGVLCRPMVRISGRATTSRVFALTGAAIVMLLALWIKLGAL
jgi:oligosaccharide repeat unit polymerase